jgi:hypothetical protein
MMPRMAGDIMGRRRQLAISQPCLSVRLPFEIHAVAAGAFSAVNSPSDVDMLIRLSSITVNRGMLPLSCVKLGIGRGGYVATDAQQRAEGVERVEPPVEAERELVEVGVQVLGVDAVMAAAQQRPSARKRTPRTAGRD